MSSFFSFNFLIFLPIVVLINFIVPRRFRYIWLLLTSIFFYLSIDLKGAGILGLVIVFTYAAALLLSRKKSRPLLAVALIITVGMLLLCRGVNVLYAAGISFYVLKAMGYIIDVYNAELPAETNFAKYALFVSFFPLITSGPIERAGNMLPQFNYPLTVDFDRLRDGLLQMLWGYFLKLVVADRLAIFVSQVYGNIKGAAGLPSLVATLFYTFEIYCDFGGYSHIAIGMARILGIDVMKNFECPYLSGSVAEFWRRWHISLSTWFRDYLYIPLGGNRKGALRKYLNVLIVFAVSGLWHGLDFTFLLWGLLHGLYQVIGFVMRPVRDFFVRVLKVKRSSFSHRVLKVATTFVLVDYAWIFFRAPTIRDALAVIKNTFVFTPWKIADGSLYGFGLDRADFTLALLGIAIVIAVDLINYSGVVIRERLLAQGIWLRFAAGIVGIMVVLIFGIWGPGYDATSFIYQQF